MTQQLKRLRETRRNLQATLNSLNHKEEILQLKIDTIERETSQRGKLTPEDNRNPVGQVSAKLDRIAEDLMEAKPSAETYSEIHHLITFPNRTASEEEEKRRTLGSSLDFDNRVRVQRNVMFSWSYRKCHDLPVNAAESTSR
jgi:fructose-1,6-bisphosphatase